MGRTQAEGSAMPADPSRTALVTGANSGLGLEAAAQLAEAGWGRVIITSRNDDKANGSRSQLIERTGRDVFEPLTLDLAHLDTVEKAAAQLASHGVEIDFLLLNAGILPGRDATHNDDGIEMTYAAALLGHHLLTARLLERNVLAPDARIVIAGSEAARGDVPMMNVVDMPAFAAEHFSGDLEAAVDSHARMAAPVRHKTGNTYANVKMFNAWWAAALARRLPAGMAVNAVSPGSAPDTNAARHQGFMMRKVLLPMMKAMPKRMAMAGSVETAAGRYLQAADFADDVSGQFFASPPKKMIGDLTKVDLPHINDEASQEAAWNVVVRLARGADVRLARGADVRLARGADVRLARGADVRLARDADVKAAS